MLNSPKGKKKQASRAPIQQGPQQQRFVAPAPYYKQIDPMTGLLLKSIHAGDLKKAIAQFKSYAWFYSQFPAYPSYVNAIFSLAVRKQDAEAIIDFAGFFQYISHSPEMLEHLPFIAVNEAWPVLYALLQTGVIAVNFPFVGGHQYGYVLKGSLLLDRLKSLKCPQDIMATLKHRFNAICFQDLQNFELARQGAWAALQQNFDHGLVDVNARDLLPNEAGQLGLTISDYAYLAKQYSLAYQTHSEKNKVYINRLFHPKPIRMVPVQQITAPVEDEQVDNTQDEYSLGLVQLLERLAVTKPSPYVTGYPPPQVREAAEPSEIPVPPCKNPCIIVGHYHHKIADSNQPADASSSTHDTKGPRKRFD